MIQQVEHARDTEVAARAMRLKQARLAAGFKTAKAAALALGWNPNTYASNENANAPFSFRRAEAYATALGVPVLWLYSGDGSPRRSPTSRRRRALNSGTQIDLPIIGEVAADGACRLEPIAMAAAPTFLGSEHVYLRIGQTDLEGVAPAGALLAFGTGEAAPNVQTAGCLVVAGLEDGSVAVGTLVEAQYGFTLAGRPGAVAWAQAVEAVIMPPLSGTITRTIDAPP